MISSSLSILNSTSPLKKKKQTECFADIIEGRFAFLLVLNISNILFKNNCIQSFIVFK